MLASSTSLSKAERLSILYEVISYVVKLISTALLTNFLTPRHYSHVVVATFTFGIVSPLLLHGTALSIFNFLGQYLVESNDADADAFLSWQLKVLIVGSIFFVLISILLGVGLFVWYPNFYKTDYNLIIIFLFLVPFWSIMRIQGNVLLAIKQYTAYFITSVVSQLFWLSALLGLFILINKKLTDTEVVISYYGSYLITIIMQFIWLRIQPKVVSLKSIWQTKKSRYTSQWRKYSYELFLNSEFFNIKTLMGVYILELFATDKAASATYSVIFVVSNLIYKVSSAMTKVIIPLISNAVKSSSNLKNFQQVINSTNLVQLICGVILLAIIFFCAKPILGLFGAHYEKSAWTLKVFSFLIFLSNFNSNGNTILNYTNHVRISIWISGIIALINVVLGSILTYYEGLNGLLICLGVLILIGNLVACGFVRTKYGIKVMTFF